MDPRITLVTLGVADVDVSTAFYRDGPGFPMQEREPDSDIAFFTLDRVTSSTQPAVRFR